MKREGDAFTPHGDVKSYDPDSGVLVVHFDFQESTHPPYSMTPEGDGKYSDQDGRAWALVR